MPQRGIFGLRIVAKPLPLFELAPTPLGPKPLGIAALALRPSMIEASSSLRPSAVNTAPRPALNKGESSSTRMAVSTPSRLEPPGLRNAS
jgi:hypothetical protein